MVKTLFLALILIIAPTSTVVGDEGKIKNLLDNGIAYYHKGKCDLAINDLRKVVENNAASDDMKAQAQLVIGRCYFMKKDYLKAIAELKKVETDFPDASRQVKAESLLDIANACNMLKKHNKAIEACQKVLNNYGDVNKETLWKARTSMAHFFNNKDEPEKALEAYRECLKYNDSLSNWYAVQSYLRLANQSKLLGKKEEAAGYYFRVLDEYEDSWHSWTESCLGLIDCTDSEELLKKTQERCNDIICESPEARIVAQEGIVRILLKLGEYKKALSHAKIYLDICSFSEIKKGIDYILVSLKGTDRNLVRINQFLQYLKFGEKGLDGEKGTDDDVENPFKQIEYVKEPDREAKILRAIKKSPKDMNGHISKSELYLLINDRGNGLKELRNAYLVCPLDQAKLQEVTDRITKLITLISGGHEMGEQFVNYQQYGKNGEDGKPGTEDDLQDVLEKTITDLGEAHPCLGS